MRHFKRETCRRENKNIIQSVSQSTLAQMFSVDIDIIKYKKEMQLVLSPKIWN